MIDKKLEIQEGESVIKQIRDKLELSQEEFARRLGVTLQTVGRWERGISDLPRLTVPQFRQLLAVLAEVGLTIDDIPDRFGPSENAH